MVAYVSGDSLGLFNTSQGVLGNAGGVGDPSMGRSGEDVTVNAATGNLIIQRRDEYLAGAGLDLPILRTYNSQGLFDDDNGDNWRIGFSRAVSALTGTLDAAGSSLTRTGEDGAAIVYTYDVLSGQYVSDAGSGARDTLTYDGSSGGWIWRNGSSQVTERYAAIAADGQLLSVTDSNGNTVNLTWNGNLLASIADADGERIDLIYDTAAGKTANLREVHTVTKVNAADDNPTYSQTRVRYDYDSLNRLYQVTVDLTPGSDNDISDGKVYTTIYGYDGISDRVASITQTDGSQLQFLYDAGNRVEQVKDIRSSTDVRVTTLDYSVANQTTITDASGNATVMAYDGDGQLARLTQPGIGDTVYAYDAKGNVARVTDPKGNATIYGYDSQDNRIYERDASGNVISRAYDGANRLTAETRYRAADPDGSGNQTASQPETTRYVYDSRGNLRFAITPEGRVTEYRYDTHGLQRSQISYTGAQFDPDASIATSGQDFSADTSGLNIPAAADSGEYFTLDNGALNVTRQLSSTSVSYVATGSIYQPLGTTFAADITTDANASQRFFLIGAQNGGSGTMARQLSAYFDGNNLYARYINADGTTANALLLSSVKDNTTYTVEVVTGAGGATLYVYEKGKTRADGVAYTHTIAGWDQAQWQLRVDSNSSVTSTSTMVVDNLRTTAQTWTQNFAADTSGLTIDPADQTAGYFNIQGSLNVARRYSDTATSQTIYGSTNYAIGAGFHAEIVTDASTNRYFQIGANNGGSGAAARRLTAYLSGNNLYANYLDADGNASSMLLLSGVKANTAYVVEVDTSNTGATLYVFERGKTRADGVSYTQTIDGWTQARWMITTQSANTVTSPSVIAVDQLSTTQGDMQDFSVDASGLTISSTLQAQGYFTLSKALVAATRSGASVVTHQVSGSSMQPIGTGFQADVTTDASTQRYALVGIDNGQASGTGARRMAAYLNGNVLYADYFDAAGINISTRIGTVQANTEYMIEVETSADGATLYMYPKGRTRADGMSFTQTIEGWSQARWFIQTKSDPAVSVPTALAINSLSTSFAGSALTEAALASWAAQQDLGKTQHTDTCYDLRGQISRVSRYATVNSAGVGVRDGSQSDTVFVYDPWGELVQTVDPRGVSTAGTDYVATYAYDGLGRLRTHKQIDQYGNSLTLSCAVYNDPLRQSTVTLANGLTTVSTYDRGGQVISVVQTDSSAGNAEVSKTSYVIDLLGRTVATRVSTSNGSLLSSYAVYDAAGRKVADIDADGALTEYVYNADSQVIKTIAYANLVPAASLAGDPAAFSLDALRPATSANDRVTRKLYDAAGRVAESIDAEGAVTRYQYDGQGQLIATTAYANRLTAAQLSGIDTINGPATMKPGQMLAADQSVYSANGRYRLVLQSDGNLVEYDLQQNSQVVWSTQTSGSGADHFAFQTDGNLVLYKGSQAVWSTRTNGDPQSLILQNDGNLVLYVSGGTPAWASGFMVPGQALYAGQALYSADHRYALWMQTDGNVVIYDLQNNNQTAWSTNTAGSGADRLVFQTDGNLALYQGSRLIGAVGGAGPNHQAVFVQPDGSLAMSSAAGTIIWSSQVSDIGTAAQANGNNFINADPVPATDAANDRVTRQFYSDDGLLLGALDAEGYLTEYRYDGAGQRVQVIQYATATTATTADLRAAASDVDMLRPSANAGDVTTTFLYNAEGQLTGTIDGEGYLTEKRYDAAGNVAQTIRYANHVATSGIIGASIDDVRPAARSADQKTVNQYDAYNRLFQSQSLPDNLVTSYQYDSAGNLIGVSASSGINQRQDLKRYDVLGRLTAELSGEDAAKITPDMTQAQIDAIWVQYATKYTYDESGLQASVTDALGRKTLYYYDNDGRSTYTVNGAGEVSLNVYDAFGGKTQEWRTKGRLSTAQLSTLSGGLADDAFNTALNAIIGAGAVETYNVNFTLRGQIAAIYDGLGRNTEQRVYNAFGELQGKGELVDVTQPMHVDMFSYDRRGLVLTGQDDVNGINAITANEYDAFGRLIKNTAPDGTVSSHRYDRLGREVTTTVGAITKNYTYDAFGRSLTITDSDGATTYAYDDVNRKMTVTTPGQVITSQTRNEFGDIVTVTDGRGNVTTYAYNRDGQVLSVTDPTGKVATDYDAAGQVIWSKDRNGIYTHYTYDAAGRVLTRTLDPAQVPDANGVLVDNPGALAIQTATQYDALGEAIWQQDANGTWTRTDYDANGRVWMVEVAPAHVPGIKGDLVTNANALALKTSYSYDAAGNTLVVIEDVDGAIPKITQYTYDNLGRRIGETIDPIKVNGVPNPNPNPLNIVTTYNYDDAGNLIDKTDADHNTSYYGYDSFGRQTVQIDATGSVTRTIYDALNRVHEVRQYKDAVSMQALAAFPALGASGIRKDTDLLALLPGGINDANYVTTQTLYNQDGQQQYRIDAAGGVTQYDYDASGNVSTVTRYANVVPVASGATVTTLQAALTHDASRDQVTRYTYDAANRLVAEAVAQDVDASGVQWWSITKQAYDGQGNLIEKISYANKVSSPDDTPAADPSHDNHVCMAYDAAGRMTASAQAQHLGTGGALLWSVSSQSYDSAGHLVGRTDYATFLPSPTLQSRPTPAQIAAWLGTVTHDAAHDRAQYQAYDAAGRLVYSIDAVGTVTQYTLDNVGRVTQQHVYATPLALTGPAKAADIHPTASFADRITTTVYDAAGRAVYIIDALGNVVQNTYDAMGNNIVTRAYAKPIVLPDSPTLSDMAPQTDAADRITRRAFDAANRLAYSIDALGYVTETNYDALGFVSSTTRYAVPYTSLLTLPPPLKSTVDLKIATPDPTVDCTDSFFYDAAGRLRKSTDALGNSEFYSYDGVGNKKTFTNKKGSIWTYTYDAAGRMTSEATPTVKVTRVTTDAGDNAVLNASGNPVTTTATVPLVTTLAYDALGNLVSRTEATGQPEQRITSYRYDAAGRQTVIIYPQVRVYAGESDSQLETNGASGDAIRMDRLVTPTDVVLYDALGNAVAHRDVGGNYNYKIYDKAGRVLSDIDALGYITGYVRNAFGDATQLTRYALPTNTADYGLTPVAVSPTISSQDRTVITQYDNLGRVIKVIEPQVYTRDGVIDTNGNLATHATVAGDPATAAAGVYFTSGKTTATTYNAFGDVLRESVYGQDKNGKQNTVSADTYYRYNLLGQKIAQITVKDAAPGATKSAAWLSKMDYDPFGNLQSQTDYARAVTIVYSNWSDVTGMPNVVAADDNANRTTIWTYDLANRKTSETHTNIDADGVNVNGDAVTSFTYDALGNQTSTTDAMGVTTYTYYDALGRVTATATPPISAMRSQIAQLYIALLNRAPDAVGLASWLDRLQSGTTLTQAALEIYGSSEAQALYGAESDSAFIGNVYRFLFSRTADSSGLSAWVGNIASLEAQGNSQEQARTSTVLGMISASIDALDNDTVVMNSKIAAALNSADGGNNSLAVAKSVVADAAATAKLRIQVVQAYEILLGRGPGADSLNAWVADMQPPNNWSLQQVAQAIYDSEESRALYPDGITISIQEKVTRIYQNAYGSPPDTDTFNSWLNVFKSDESATYPIGKFVTDMLNAVTASANIGTASWQQLTDKVAAALPESIDINLGATTLTEFGLDIYGNVVQRIDHGNGARYATLPSAGNAGWAAIASDAAHPNRTTTALYDVYGREIENIDAEKHASFTSYDAWGHVAKQWRTVTDVDGNKSTYFKVIRYDALGQMTDTVIPASNNVVAQVPAPTPITPTPTPPPTGMMTVIQAAPLTTVGLIDSHTDYNAFGETIDKKINGETYESDSYDNAGHLWRTNAGDGVFKVNLYDVAGHQTAQITSAVRDLSIYASASAVTPLSNILLNQTQYDFLGNAIKQVAPLQYSDDIGPSTADPSQENIDVATEVEAVPMTAVIRSVEGSQQGVPNTVQLTWASLAGLGSGDINIRLDYVSNGVGYTVGRTFSYRQALTGAIITWTGAEGPAINDITRVQVWKSDVNGVPAKLFDQKGGVAGQWLQFDAPADPTIKASVKYRTSGSGTAWVAASSLPVKGNFGDAVVADLTSLGAGNYDYQIIYTKADGTKSTYQTGILTIGATSTVTPDAGSGTPAGASPVIDRTFDRWGNVLSVSDPRNSAWLTQYRYNAFNQSTVVTDALGNQTKSRYDKRGRQISTTDGNGNVTGMRYDAMGNLAEVLQADGGVVQTRYDAFGDKVFVRQADGAMTAYTYDRLGRLKSTTLAATVGVDTWKSSITVTNDAAGNPVKHVTVSASPTHNGQELTDSYRYDELGRRISQTNAANETVKTYYDLLGNVIENVDAAGDVTSFVWDNFGHKTAQSDSGYFMYWKWSNGLLMSHVDLSGTTISYGYNYLHQLLTQTSSGSGHGNMVNGVFTPSPDQNLLYTYDNRSGLLVRIDDKVLRQVTQYAYDLAGNHTREKTSTIVRTTQNGVTTIEETGVAQDNHIAYDALGRISDVGDDRFSEHIGYDANGNRIHVKTTYYGADFYEKADKPTLRTVDAWNAYDSMNRQTIIDGISTDNGLHVGIGYTQLVGAGNSARVGMYDESGDLVLSDTGDTVTVDSKGVASSGAADQAIGQQVCYDDSGNRTMVREYGKQLAFNTTTNDPTDFLWKAVPGFMDESYAYDAANRLVDTYRNGIDIESRRYDAAGRIIWSAPVANVIYPDSAMEKMSLDSSTRMNHYDAAGRMDAQSTFSIDGISTSDLNYYYSSNGVLQYYRLAVGNNYVNSYQYSYAGGLFDTFQVMSITVERVAGPAAAANTTNYRYDSNGYLTNVSGGGRSSITLINDVAGRALAKVDTHTLIVDNAVMGSHDNSGDTFRSDYVALVGTDAASEPGSYTVQPGETLQSIAKAAWGDANLWYLIADANGIDSVDAGQVIVIPNRTSAVYNNSQTFTPYNQAKVIGDVTPQLQAPPPPPAGDAGCGAMEQAIVLIVVIAVTVMTQGATAEMLGAAGGYSATEVTVMSAVAGGLAGDAAGQVVGMTVGTQDGFNMDELMMSGFSAGIGAGVGAEVGSLAGKTLDATSKAIISAAIGNTLSQGLSVAMGTQDHFNWLGVVASAVGAGVGSGINQDLLGAGKGTDFTRWFSNPESAKIAADAISGVGKDLMTSAIQDGHISLVKIAADAFGNALGQSIVTEIEKMGNSDTLRKAMHPVRAAAGAVTAAGTSASTATTATVTRNDGGYSEDACVAPTQVTVSSSDTYQSLSQKIWGTDKMAGFLMMANGINPTLENMNDTEVIRSLQAMSSMNVPSTQALTDAQFNALVQAGSTMLNNTSLAPQTDVDKRTFADAYSDATGTAHLSDYAIRTYGATGIPSYLAVQQNTDPTCYYLSSVGSLARQNPGAITSLILDNGKDASGNDTYKVTFPGQDPVIVSDSMSFTRVDTKGNADGAVGMNDNGNFVRILENAAAVHYGGSTGLNDPNWTVAAAKGWTAMDGGLPIDALHLLTGNLPVVHIAASGQPSFTFRTRDTYTLADGPNAQPLYYTEAGASCALTNNAIVFYKKPYDFSSVVNDVQNGNAVVVGSVDTSPARKDLITEHAYSVVGVEYDKTTPSTPTGIVLFNPAGTNAAKESPPVPEYFTIKATDFSPGNFEYITTVKSH